MHLLTATAIALVVLASASPEANEPRVTVIRVDSQPSSRAPEQYFTGSVHRDPLFPVTSPSRLVGGSVTFEAGARSAWHAHPLSQILILTAGVSRVQQWGGPVQEIRPGDVVRIPPGVKHWHGAAPTTAMTHIALTEELDGTNTDWLEKVSDEQYGQ